MPPHWSPWDLQVSGHSKINSTMAWNRQRHTTNLIGHCDTCRPVHHAPPSYDKHSVEACYPSHRFGSDIANVNRKTCCCGLLLILHI